MERRLRARPGTARHPARLDPRHRAHRDDPRRVRDGRDPVRAARPRGRSQRRSLGLHLQHHQEVPIAPRVRAAGSRIGDDDGPVHARLHASFWCRRATGAARMPWAAWRPSSRRAAMRRSTSAPWPPCDPTRSANRRTASTAPGSHTPISCLSRTRCSPASSASVRTRRSGAATTSAWRRPSCWT